MFNVKDFYDDLASDYHLMFEDWSASVRNQGNVLHKFLQASLASPPLTILDCTCGIGTQSIGLALHGYKIRATDISSSAIDRARLEAKKFEVSLEFAQANLLTLDSQVGGEFDLVISCDNSVSHLVTDADLDLAMKNIFSKVKRGGHFLATTRDYGALLANRPCTTMPILSEKEGERRVSFQIWKWAADLKTYHLELFFFHDKDGRWDVRSKTGMYRALTRDELNGSLALAGFKEIKWYFPNTTGFYQPLVVATKP